jgi:exodeoxyribonuclease V alpha subunit
VDRAFEDVLARLGRSRFRARFVIRGRELDYLRRLSPEKLREHARDFVTKRLAPAAPPNDGRQTPMRNHPVFVAQHATATCCRGCLERWHRVPRGRELAASEVDWIVGLIAAHCERFRPPGQA